MKKIFIPLIILLVIVSLLSACGKTTTTTATATSTSTTTQVSTATTQTTATSTQTQTSTTQTTATTTSTSPSGIVKGGTLRWVYPYSPGSSPGWPNDSTEYQRLWLLWICYEPLVKVDVNVVPQPWLATSWEWAPDNLSITFNLRKGVKFHDGTEFTSEAVKMEGDFVIEAKQANAANWDRWEIIDDYTVRLYLKQYQNDFWPTLTNINMTFFSPTAYKANQPNGQQYIKEHPIGTGPFKFVKFEKDVTMEFVKNDNYWQAGKPYLDGIKFITVKERLTQQATMEAGEGDILSNVGGQILDDLKKKGFVINARYGGTDFIMFDTMTPTSIYNNVNIRKAVEYAIDKEALAKTLGYGYYMAANQMPPAVGNPAYNPDLPWRSYNPDQARVLLAEAGFAGGFDAKMITMGTSVPAKDLSIQQYLIDVDINVALDLVDNQTFWNYMRNGWTEEMVSTGYAVGPNWPNWLKSTFKPTGSNGVSVKLPDEIIAKIIPALNEADPVKAKVLSDELIRMVFDDCSIVPIYNNALGFILSPKVHDTYANDIKWYDWSVWEPENTWISK